MKSSGFFRDDADPTGWLEVADLRDLRVAEDEVVVAGTLRDFELKFVVWVVENSEKC